MIRRVVIAAISMALCAVLPATAQSNKPRPRATEKISDINLSCKLLNTVSSTFSDGTKLGDDLSVYWTNEVLIKLNVSYSMIINVENGGIFRQGEVITTPQNYILNYKNSESQKQEDTIINRITGEYSYRVGSTLNPPGGRPYYSEISAKGFCSKIESKPKF